ncbi:MAG TPA: hypothetical protein VKZ82_28365 [Nonomuraea sp.]|nr:hypothetical protein [Nonomuraea sp.]
MTQASLNITEVRIHRVMTDGVFVTLNGRWVNLTDHTELAAVAAELTDIAARLRAMHEEEMDRER